MKRKLSIYTIIVTVLLLSGCSQQNNGKAENNTVPNTASPTASAQATPAATQSNNTAPESAVTDNNATDNTVTNNNAMQEGNTGTNNNSSESNASQNNNTEASMISEDEAKQIALAKVEGATEQDIRKFKSEYDNGRLEYEGKIYYDSQEYEFEIDGYTGEILEWDVETIYGTSAASEPTSR